MSNRRKVLKVERSASQGRYNYTKLKDLTNGRQVHVFALVVTFVPPAPNLKGYSCSLTLVDEAKLEVDCNMSHSNISHLPHSLYPGDIICMRKVTVEGQEQHLALKTTSYSSWMVFRKKEDFKPFSCSSEFKLSAGSSENTRMLELKRRSAQEALTSGSTARNRGLKRTRSGSPKSMTKSSCDSSPRSQQSHTSTTTSPTSPHSLSSHTPYAHSSHTHLSRTAHVHSPHASHSHYSHAARAYPSHSPHSNSTTTVLPVPCSHVSRPLRNRFYDTQLSTIANQVVGSKDAGVMGLVKYFKPPFRSKGSDFCTVFYVIDDSQSTSGLTCVLFNPHKDGLPTVCSSGELLMVKGLSVNMYQSALQGVGHENSLVGVFPVNVTAPTPQTIGDWYAMKDVEKIRLEQLRSWADGTELPFLINSKLEEISLANYCSTLCVVVAVHRAPTGSNGVVLTVTDGTLPKYPLATDTSSLETLSNDPVLHYMYQELTSTVVVSTASQPQVTAGNVVQLVNVCMVKKLERTVSSVSAMGRRDSVEKELVGELVLEDHPSYQGALKIQPSTVASAFKSKMSVLEGPYPIWRSTHSLPGLSTKILCDDGELATLEQIQSASPVGAVCVVDVKVVGMGSACSKLEDMSQLRCPECMTLYVTPQPQADNYHQLLSAGDPCVCCCQEDREEEEEEEEGVALCFMYAFSLLVADHTAQLELAVSGSEGSKFLHQTPANFFSDLPARDALLSLMYQMTGGNDPFHRVPLDPRFSQPRPSLKLCITVVKSYTGQRMYKITDTILLQDCQ